MNIIVKNTSLQNVDIIDVFESMIWVEKFNDCGSFELYTPVTLALLELLQEDYYLSIEGSNTLMIIESLEIRTDIEVGNRLIVRGRSLISILDRRILLGQKFVDGSLQDAFEEIMNQNIIDSTQPHRNIPGVVFDASSDPIITDLELQAQYDGDNVWEVFSNLAKIHNFGMKMDLNSSNQFVFSLYAGTDRSYAQSTNPYVIFSPRFDNLLNSTYFQTSQFYKTYNLVFGDPSSGPAHRVEAFRHPSGLHVPLAGLARRESHLNASFLSKYIEGTSTEISVPEYVAQLKALGVADLHQNWSQYAQFDGEADTTNSYKYGVDFFLGDVVQIENEYGFQGRSRITEVTISRNLEGGHIFPTFTKL